MMDFMEMMEMNDPNGEKGSDWLYGDDGNDGLRGGQR